MQARAGSERMNKSEYSIGTLVVVVDVGSFAESFKASLFLVDSVLRCLSLCG